MQGVWKAWNPRRSHCVHPLLPLRQSVPVAPPPQVAGQRDLAASRQEISHLQQQMQHADSRVSAEQSAAAAAAAAAAAELAAAQAELEALRPQASELAARLAAAQQEVADSRDRSFALQVGHTFPEILLKNSVVAGLLSSARIARRAGGGGRSRDSSVRV